MIAHRPLLWPRTYSKIDPAVFLEFTQARRKVGCYGRHHDHNANVLSRLANLRAKEARMCGYSNYAKFAWQDNVFKTGKQMESFLDEIAVGLKTTEKIATSRDHKIAYEDPKCHPKIALNALTSFLNDVWGMEFVETSRLNWNPEATRFMVKKDGKLLGHISLDLFKRKNKQSMGAAGAAYYIQKRYRRSAGLVQYPAAHIQMNADQNTWTHEDVTTLFHEMDRW